MPQSLIFDINICITEYSVMNMNGETTQIDDVVAAMTWQIKLL